MSVTSRERNGFSYHTGYGVGSKRGHICPLRMVEGKPYGFLHDVGSRIANVVFIMLRNIAFMPSLLSLFL